MKKRAFAILLAAVLCIGLLPTNVLAEEAGAPEEAVEEEIAVVTAETEEGETEETAGNAEEEDSSVEAGDTETDSENESEVETEADWEATLPQDLTGTWSEDVVAVAKSQVGYTESEGYNRYGAWYGDESDDWDATFVSFCLYYADVPESEFPQASGADAWIRALKDAEQEMEAQLYADVSDTVPQSGDLVFLDTDEDGKADHVGIAEKVETEETDAEDEEADTKEIAREITVIEGDSNNAVEEKEYKAEDGEIASEDAAEAAVIMGYGILPLQADEEDEEDESGEDPEISELAYESAGSGRVVINLGNSNGLCNFADYSGERHTEEVDGEIYLRYTTDVLDAYADDDGNLTINLPSEKDLPSEDDSEKTFTVVNAVGTEGEDGYLPAVTVELGNCAAYKYTLIGWVNIATGKYYAAGAEAEINLDDQNVFYADWIAASYDHGSSTDSNLADTVSTKDFVTMHLYDFNEIFNMYSAKVEQNVEVDESSGDATITETWSDSGTMYDTLMGANLENGTRQTNSFIFVDDGATEKAGQLGYVANQTDGNKWTGTGNLPRNAYTEWGITSPDSAPLPMLFDSSESYHGIHYVGEGDYLFQYDEDKGYYYFNSDQTTATYNQTDGRFYVYKGTQTVGNVNFPCFLPFNDYVSGLDALNGSVDYWFGMDMTVNFYLSNRVGQGGNLVNGEHMVFNFSGDDDILIFIDDELVLDMSGIHDESFGSIDFTDGTVKIAMSEEGLAIAEATYFSLGSGNHELEVYYMERGARASNLEIEFNIMPLWAYESGDVQTVTAEKVWQNADSTAVEDTADLPAVEVGLFDAVSAATDEDPGYTVNGNTYTFEYTDDKNVYHKYVYTVSSGGDSLEYTEGDTTVTYTDTNSDGKVVDNDGLVIAWLEGEKLHVRIDEQTLSNENDWTYAWELLDADGNYEAIELSESSAYTTSSASENLTTYQYWSIIGESEIESHVGDSDYPIILTEAAQEASGSIGDTKEAYGWVIVGTTNGVETTQVKFSQVATMETKTDEISNTQTYYGVYGVTSQSEIDALGSGAVWYMKDANKTAGDVSGESLEEFYIYCILDGTKYYLALDKDTNGLMTTTSEDYGATFYYDALGELLVDITIDEEDSEIVRVEILEDGTINIGEPEEGAATDDIRIYTLSETSTSGFAFTATNTLASTKVTVTKEWDDEQFSQNRPDEVTVQLYADGAAYGDAVQLTESGGWTYTWENLPAYTYSDGEATEITYTVQEEDVTGYTTTYGEVTGDAENGYSVTLTNSTSMEKLSIQKVVSGTTDTSEFTFEITLKNGDTAYDGEIEVTYSDGSTGTLTFADGTAEVTLTANETITLALPYGMTWEVTELTEGADTVVIYVDNEIKDAASGEITKDTSVRFVNSYRGYFPIDEEIVPDYTDRTTWVKDEAVNEYNAIEIEMSTLLPIVTGYELENGDFTMNFHEILDHELILDEVDSDFMVFIGGNQIDHQYYTVTLAVSSASPASIQPYSTGGTIDDGCTFHVDVDLTALYKDGVITEDDLQGSTEIIIFFFADLEGTGLNGTYKSTVWYEIYDGDELLYTSNEDIVYVFTYEIDITKYDASTLDGSDYDGSALAGATLGVYYDKACTDPVSRNGEAYAVTSDEDGKAIFYGLANGVYYVKEVTAPEGYALSTQVLTVVLGEELNDNGYMYEGYFANTPESRDISGAKTWKDDNDKADARPDSITVNLYQNGKLYDSKTVTAGDGWAWSWTGLPKYDENNEAYAYTIKEDKVEYYTTTYYEGNFNITNTFGGEQTGGPDQGGDNPKTGDSNNLLLWALVMLLCGLVIAEVYQIRKRIIR